MKTLHTIMEIRVAIGSETVVAMEFQFRRRRWQQLQRANEQGKDPAWISLAMKAQLEAQLTALEKRNPSGCPLYGVPFAIKDNIGVAGWTTTAACPEFAYMAERTAPIVEQLQHA
jgi:Asp-tRNA(Asn)/Glu-tRNA(Gln) amidotransferase A subunit family amidase